MDVLWDYMKHYVIPTPHNAYRPHLLNKPWLLFFVALVLAAEGFLVANLVVHESSTVYLAAAGSSEVILTKAEHGGQQTTSMFARLLTRIDADPQLATTSVLSAVALFLGVLVVMSFFVHIQVQPTDMLLSGAVIALFALSLIGLNGRLLSGPTPLEATAVEVPN